MNKFDREFQELLEKGSINEEIISHDFSKMLGINLNNTKSKLSQKLLIGENELGYEIKLDNRFTQLYESYDSNGDKQSATWRLSIELGRIFRDKIDFKPGFNNNFDKSGIYKPEEPKYYIQGSPNLYYVFDTQHLIYLDKLLILMDSNGINTKLLSKDINLVGSNYIKKMYIPREIAEKIYLYKFTVLENDKLSYDIETVSGLYNHKRLRNLHVYSNDKSDLNFNRFVYEYLGKESYELLNKVKISLIEREIKKENSEKFINNMI